MKRLALIFLVPALLGGLLPAAASAKAPKNPKVSKVSPMRVKVGQSLTIRGSSFKTRARSNTVIFRVGSRSIFVKPRSATRRKLVIRLPKSLDRLMRHNSRGQLVPTRFSLQVASGRFSKRTSRRLSPVIVPSTGNPGVNGEGNVAGPADCDGDGILDNVDTSSDGDLLPDSLERSIHTDPCLADTDGDGAEDGYEYQSSIDLNHYPATAPLPYPGKRPYPNALDPTDGPTDYDGDGLSLLAEHLLWERYSSDGVARTGHPTTLASLNYSDGLQRSQNVPVPPAGTLLRWALSQDGDGVLADNERDGDGDGLGNWDEFNGRFTETWWPAEHNGTIEPKESKYPGINFLDNPDTASGSPASLRQGDIFADSDSDGDGVPDGADDNDHDGLTNQFEVARPNDWLNDAFPFYDPTVATEDQDFSGGTNVWAYTNPFNPCKPYNSDRCHTYVPFGYYDGDEVPPVGPTPPAGYPGTHPTTPNG